jgi:hypothetical protein
VRTPTLPARGLPVALAALLLAGCQASTGGSLPTSAEALSLRGPGRPLSIIDPARAAVMRSANMPLPSWMKPAPAMVKGYAWVSQFNFTDVNEYAANNKKNAPPRCQIHNQSYVNGIGVDASGNVWIPQGGVFTGITTEFKPNCGKALLSINDTDGQPAAIAFDSKRNVYIENIMNASGIQGNIDVYKPGATKPTMVLQDTNAVLRWFDIAIDKSDNVFMVYSDVYNKGHVVEFPGGKNTPKALPMSIGFPGGITFDSLGRLLVVDQDAANVSVYKAPFTGRAIATFALKADSVPCRFRQDRKMLYCADFTNASVDVYTYDASKPAATSYAYSFNNGIQPRSSNDGIALAPAPPN